MKYHVKSKYCLILLSYKRKIFILQVIIACDFFYVVFNFSKPAEQIPKEGCNFDYVTLRKIHAYSTDTPHFTVI